MGRARRPARRLLNALTFPFLRPIRSVVPPIGGTLDLSPLIVIVLAQLVLMLPVPWLESDASTRCSLRLTRIDGVGSALSRAASALASRTKSATDSVSPRARGIDARAPQIAARVARAPASALRSVLRRWPNAAATMRAKSAASAMRGCVAPSGTRRATAESTFGAGRNAPGGTMNSRVDAKRACSITVSRP